MLPMSSSSVTSDTTTAARGAPPSSRVMVKLSKPAGNTFSLTLLTDSCTGDVTSLESSSTSSSGTVAPAASSTLASAIDVDGTIACTATSPAGTVIVA